ncbi:hypothetical protein pb186bvf_014266 [Paramecium bursaria]
MHQISILINEYVVFYLCDGLSIVSKARQSDRINETKKIIQNIGKMSLENQIIEMQHRYIKRTISFMKVNPNNNNFLIKSIQLLKKFIQSSFVIEKILWGYQENVKQEIMIKIFKLLISNYIFQNYKGTKFLVFISEIKTRNFVPLQFWKIQFDINNLKILIMISCLTFSQYPHSIFSITNEDQINFLSN